MTVRCDACGTENRDKAMFCRGCAGKLPAFALTKKPLTDGNDARKPVSPSVGASGSSDTAHGLRSERPDRSFLSGTGARIVLFSLLMVVLGVSAAWLMQVSAETGRRVAPTLNGSLADDPLPPEASLSTGETLEEDDRPNDIEKPQGPPLSASDAASTEAKAQPSSKLPNDTSGMNASPDPAPTDMGPATPSRSTGRRSAAAAHGGGRASDPRIGCEHLFFAFAARCEANHCQQSAYSRHPRCDAVREQRRRDDARRNSMPTS